ncbi:MAG: JAB domain-containing protein [Deltaproteobacteria bacterium]
MNQSIVNVREVFKSVLLSSATPLVLIQKHTFLDPTPSRDDIAIKKDHILSLGYGLFVVYLQYSLEASTCHL